VNGKGGGFRGVSVAWGSRLVPVSYGELVGKLLEKKRYLRSDSAKRNRE